MLPKMQGLPARLVSAAFVVRRVVLYLAVAAVLMNLAMGPLAPIDGL